MKSETYRTKFFDGDYRHDPKTDFFCCKCQKDMDPSKPCRAVHLVDGGSSVLHPADEAQYTPDDRDLGCHPIGSNCAKKLGLEWTHPETLFARSDAA